MPMLTTQRIRLVGIALHATNKVTKIIQRDIILINHGGLNKYLINTPHPEF